MFNFITGINESKTLVKHISCECKYKFDGRKFNSNHWWNNDKCWCECKSIIYARNIVFRILLHVLAKIVNIYANIIDNSVIMFDELIDVEVK